MNSWRGTLRNASSTPGSLIPRPRSWYSTIWWRSISKTSTILLIILKPGLSTLGHKYCNVCRRGLGGEIKAGGGSRCLCIFDDDQRRTRPVALATNVAVFMSRCAKTSPEPGGTTLKQVIGSRGSLHLDHCLPRDAASAPPSASAFAAPPWQAQFEPAGSLFQTRSSLAPR